MTDTPSTFVSRRAFVAGGMTIASSLLLPRIPGMQDAFALPGAAIAYADEGTGTSAGDSSQNGAGQANIMVVGRTELGIVAYDVTDPDNPVPVPDCTVKLTSRATKVTLEGTANKEGKIIFDLTTLAEDKNAETLAFNGRIEVTCKGYRDVIIPLTRIRAHAAVIAPTRPLDGKPYFRSLSMNEWDIQYSEQVFLTSTASDKDQLIEAELYNPTAGTTPSASLVYVQGGKETTHGSFRLMQMNGNYAIMQATGKYLLTGGTDCITEKDKVRVVFSAGSSSQYWCETGISTEPAPLTKSEKASSFVIPQTVSSGLNVIRIPDTFVPPFGGASITLWQPKFPVMFDFSPFGYGMFGWGMSSIAAKKDDGGDYFDADSWDKLPKKSVEEQCGDEFDAQMKELDRYDTLKAELADSKNSKKVAHECTSSFKLLGDVQIFGLLKYTWSKQIWEGSCSALAAAKFDFNWTHYLNIMGVPIYVIINPWFRFNASFRFGVKMPSLFSFDYDTDDITFGVGASIGIALTLGVGINHFFSISFTGAGNVSFFINFAPNPGHGWPRFLGGYGHSGVATIQCSFFKYTYPIWNVNHPDALDSNNNDALASASGDGTSGSAGSFSLDKRKLDSALQARLGTMGMRDCVPASTGGVPTFEELKANALIVTNEEMLKSREFETTKVAQPDNAPVSIFEMPSSLTAQEPSEPGDFASTPGISDLGDTQEDELLNDVVIIPQKEFLSGDNANNLYEKNANYLPEYNYVGTKKEGGAQLSLGVSGLSGSPLGGVKPTVDALLFEGVSSNPCMKILVTQTTGATMLFRIATVDIGGGEARPRLVYHLLQDGAWSAPSVVNFDPQFNDVSRDEMYDYEFDVTQAEGNGGHNYICAVVTSGTRPNGDETTFVRGIQAHYVSLVCLVDTYAATNRFVAEPSMTAGMAKVKEGYSLVKPRISGYSDTHSLGGSQDFCLMGTFTRSRVTEDAGVDIENGEPIAFFARWEMNATYEQKLFTITRQHSNLYSIDSIMRPVRIDDNNYSWASGSVANTRRTTVACIDDQWVSIKKIEACYKDNDSSKFSTFSTTSLASFGGASGLHASKIYPWHTDGELLATVKGKSDDGHDVSTLYHLEFDPKQEGKITATQIGPNEGAAADFVMNENDHFLFYIQNVDGKIGQTYADDSSIESDTVEHHYYIMAVAEVDGLFTKPFVFSELDHVIDNLVATTINETYVSFLASSITSIDNSQADIYDVRVPLLKCLTPVSIITKEPFAFSGEDCEFIVNVRNDGNLVALGATFTLYDEEGNDLGSKHIKFGKDTRVIKQDQTVYTTNSEGVLEASETADTNGTASGYNEGNLSGALLQNPLVAEDGSGVLVPGDTASYYVTFAIPADWRDTKNVRIALSDIEVINPTNANPGSFQDFHVALANCPVGEVEIQGAEVKADNLASGEVHERSASGDDSGSGDGSGSGADGGSGAGGAGGSTTPQTGDSGVLSMAALAVGAVGAGFAAYSARRTALEQQACAGECEQAPLPEDE